MKASDLEITEVEQGIFDGFNSFILSKDRRVFNKLVARTLLYDQVKNIPGDIVECGVFKGTGLYTFLKLKQIFNPNSSKKVIGFDFFDTTSLLEAIENIEDKEAMSALFNDRVFKHESSFKDILEKKLEKDGFLPSDYKLIQGDITSTSKSFANKNPGLKISLLYMDLDLGDPTYHTLTNLWDNITTGGLVVFDEYGYHKWSESQGVDRFAKEHNLQIHNLNYACPTAYITKQ